MDIEKTLKLAVEHHQAGRLVEAHALYKQVLAEQPDEPDALRLLGQITFSGGNAAGAIELIRKAINSRPNVVDYHIDLARIYLASGDPAAAVESYQQVLQLNPLVTPAVHLELARALTFLGKYEQAIPHAQLAVDKLQSIDALGLVGELLLATGRVQDAVDRLQSAVNKAPTRADLRGAYARALQHRGDYTLAETEFARAVAIEPRSPELLDAFGFLLVQLRRLPEAIKHLRSAITLRPAFPQAHFHLALAFTAGSQTDEALGSYRAALELNPNYVDAWEGLARVLLDVRQFESAISALLKLNALAPTSQRYRLLSNAYGGLDQLDNAILADKKAVELDPTSADAHDALAKDLKWTGQLDEAIAQCRRALELDPLHKEAHSRLVYSMLASDRFTPQQILEAHKEWGRQQTVGIVPLRRSNHAPDPDRRLRVGYISNNFRNQAVSLFTLPIIQNHDRVAFEVFCYSDLNIPDRTTAQFRQSADHWRDSTMASDPDLARKIREDRIDVLVELTGHMGNGRLRTLAYRPAPLQISYIGYQGTTGLEAVDYVLTDDWADPVESGDTNYVEKPYRLPESFFVYQTPRDAPLVGPLPARSVGYVTFGCLNAVWKASPRAVKLWAMVMSELPGSRMMILTTDCAQTNQRLLDGFARGGISADRVQLVHRCKVGEYLRRYNSIDIALDPIPFNGHTTTCDAAWMGCPTITLSGKIYAHRYGGSVLRNLNLADLVTESDAGYVAAAVRLARDLDRLAGVRQSLRFAMQDSIITHAPRFTRNLEQAYRAMWRKWCNEPRTT